MRRRSIGGTRLGFGLPSPALIRPRDRYWVWVSQQASSANEFERVGAMANAVGALELALKASDIDPRRRKAAAHIPGWPSITKLEAAFIVRHQAVHHLTIPEPEECLAHIHELYAAWKALRRQFVTKANAAQIAAELISKPQATNNTDVSRWLQSRNNVISPRKFGVSLNRSKTSITKTKNVETIAPIAEFSNVK